MNFKKTERKIQLKVRKFIKLSFFMGLATYPFALFVTMKINGVDWIMAIPVGLAFILPLIISVIGTSLLFSTEKIELIREEYKKYYDDNYHNKSNNEPLGDNTILPIRDYKYTEYIKFMNLSENSTKKDIKRQYRTMAKLYHPDKVMNQNEEGIKDTVRKM